MKPRGTAIRSGLPARSLLLRPMLWKSVIRPLMFCLPAESAHYVAMGSFAAAHALPGVGAMVRALYQRPDERLRLVRFGLTFDNPIGLAAGFDKDARWYRQLGGLGFGHTEIGTVTGQGQPGNPRPRLFRLPRDRAILNRMGFNNEGSVAVARRLATSRSAADPALVLGINIGKTKKVPVEEAISDYLLSFEQLYPWADYFTINVSSPNTPGLRGLQDREPLEALLAAVTKRNAELAAPAGHPPRPVLLKIAPDLSEHQLDEIAEIAMASSLAGLIATNTTIERSPLQTPASRVAELGAGGLSGAPLTERSRAVVRHLYLKTEGTLPIVGVGGVMSGADAWQMILAGASLVQLYTGFVYGGPGIVKSIQSFLLERLAKNNLANISEAVGGAGNLD